MLIATSLIAGMAVGAVFRLFNFPAPAPNTWAGVAGVVGLTAGYLLVQSLYQR